MDEKRKILLADDARLFIELEKTFLQRTSVDILTASNGRQALELVRQHLPDIAILDLNMPEMGGDECCRAIKQDPALKHIAVVMVTTGGRIKDQERCRDAGCNELLLKPINRAEFLATTEKLLQLSTRKERYKVRTQIRYGQNSETSLTDFSIDMSSGGLYINTGAPFEVGDSLALRFSLEEDSREIACNARVAWVNSPPKLKKPNIPAGMGVQFIDLSLEDLHTIGNFTKGKQLKPAW